MVNIFNQPPSLRDSNARVDKIYQAAKSRDGAYLKHVSGSGGCIDERYLGSKDTVAYKLVLENDYASAEFLMRYGANINSVAAAAASKGHRRYAEHLRIRYGADASLIAQGAARGGFRNYAEFLRLNHQAKVDTIAAGAALGGQIAYAEYLRYTHHAGICELAENAAMGGQFKYAEYLLLIDETCLIFIRRGAAKGGFLEHADVPRLAEKPERELIAAGAASGGYRSFAEFYRIHLGVTNNQRLAIAAALKGHFDYVESLRKNTKLSLNLIGRAAAQGGHTAYYEFIYLHHHVPMSYIVSGCCNTPHFKNKAAALRQLAFIKNDDFRHDLAKALSRYSPYSLRGQIIEIERKASKLRAIQKKYDLDFHQALHWLENNELRQFIFIAFSLMTHRGIPLDAFVTLLTFIEPDLLITDAMKLTANYKTLLAGINKKQLQQSLSHYSHGLFSKKHKTQAVKLLTAVTAADKDAEVNQLVSEEMVSCGSKKKYREILQRHLRR